VRRLADEGIIEASFVDRARALKSDDRLTRLVAGIKAAARAGTRRQSSICWPGPRISVLAGTASAKVWPTG
jgi:hypothetical protein